MINLGQKLINSITGKKVLYIATKNKDYIRIQQEINLIKKYSKEYKLIVSNKKNYFARIIEVYKLLFFTSPESYDIVFISFMPQMVVPFWRWKFKNKVVVVDFFVSIFDTLVDDRKKVAEKTMLAKVLHYIDKLTVKNVDFVICDTKAHGKFFSDEFDVGLDKLVVLYLESDDSLYYPMKLERPKSLKDKFVVLYFGSILPVQGIEVVLDVISLLKKENNIHFIIIGPINKKYQKVVSDTVTYIEWLPQQELAKYISYSDLCLAGHFSITVGKANRTIAGKTYIYQAMEKPIILGDSDANREIFHQEDGKVYFVPRGSGEALANQIYRIYEEKCEGV